MTLPRNVLTLPVFCALCAALIGCSPTPNSNSQVPQREATVVAPTGDVSLRGNEGPTALATSVDPSRQLNFSYHDSRVTIFVKQLLRAGAETRASVFVVLDVTAENTTVDSVKDGSALITAGGSQYGLLGSGPSRLRPHETAEYCLYALGIPPSAVIAALSIGIHEENAQVDIPDTGVQQLFFIRSGEDAAILPESCR